MSSTCLFVRVLFVSVSLAHLFVRVLLIFSSSTLPVCSSSIGLPKYYKFFRILFVFPSTISSSEFYWFSQTPLTLLSFVGFFRYYRLSWVLLIFLSVICSRILLAIPSILNISGGYLAFSNIINLPKCQQSSRVQENNNWMYIATNVIGYDLFDIWQGRRKLYHVEIPYNDCPLITWQRARISDMLGQQEGVNHVEIPYIMWRFPIRYIRSEEDNFSLF